MNKSLITGLVAGVVVATAGAGAAAYALKYKEPAYAHVVEVQPVQKTIRTPRQECHDDAMTGTAIIPKRTQDARTVTRPEKRCVTVYDMHIERSGYDVRYRIGEKEGNVRMDHDPGERIPLRQGQLVLDAYTGAG